MDAYAIMAPSNVELVPRVAEEPTCQKTFWAWAPLSRTTCELDAVVSVDPIWKMNTAFASFCASRAKVPVNWAVLVNLYTPGVRGVDKLKLPRS
jgi:hypothetical protein